MAIPLPGYILPFESPPYFNQVFYRNGFWLGLVINAMDNLVENMVSSIDTTSGIKYGILIGGGIGAIGVILWWWFWGSRKSKF